MKFTCRTNRKKTYMYHSPTGVSTIKIHCNYIQKGSIRLLIVFSNQITVTVADFLYKSHCTVRVPSRSFIRISNTFLSSTFYVLFTTMCIITTSYSSSQL